MFKIVGYKMKRFEENDTYTTQVPCVNDVISQNGETKITLHGDVFKDWGFDNPISQKDVKAAVQGSK